MQRLPPLANRALALVLLVIAMGCLGLFVIHPVLDAWWGGAGGGLDQSTRLLSAYARNGAAKPALQEAYAKLQQNLAAQSGYFAGGDASVAAAMLQSEVKRLVESGHGEVRTLQSLSAADVEGMRKIAIRVEFLAEAESLQRILYDIETTVPAMFVDSINIRGIETPVVEAPAGPPPKLTVRCEVYGFMRPS